MSKDNVISLSGENLADKEVEICSSVVAMLEKLLAHAQSGKLQYLAFVAGDETFYISEFRGEAAKASVVGQIELLKQIVMFAEEVL